MDKMEKGFSSLHKIVQRKRLKFSVLPAVMLTPSDPEPESAQSLLYCHAQNRIITGNNLPAVKVDLAMCHQLLSPKFFPFLENQGSFLPSNWAICNP
jgi:hypothetical protein